MLVFQRLLNEWNGKLTEGLPVLARGKISVRDEKSPQLMAESFRLVDGEADRPGPEAAGQEKAPAERAGAEKAKTLWVQMPSMDCPEYRRLRLMLIMFVGQETVKVHFRDTKKTVAAPCWVHPSLVRELKEMVGEENVVVK